ncbi:hypothetical protein LWC34_10920 [Kibdelosporangium philippinense]|uniref:Uncharacterized protein n=1 Tax=Kibdelosporangium philippinense TaxID=211113 RepID=A0ABS8Z618_9PSEU|nr:hypothetical protein [Kibdelosporangium philippinense]MCE7003334.1 hypothetical protein [Kibdelosporangium philippinense]
MSANILSVIPTEPRWQPDKPAAERAIALAERFFADDDRAEIEACWYSPIMAITSGENLVRITCPSCDGDIDFWWYNDLLERKHAGFDTLAVTVPCCGMATTLDALHYDWPCGYARFQIECMIGGSEREEFTTEEMAEFAAALGHPVRQIRAHI